MTDYKKHFSHKGFSEKLKVISGRIREEALLLYDILRDPTTPVWVKIAIIIALGYLICPMDAVPDFIPVAGYGDDLAIILATVAALKKQ